MIRKKVYKLEFQTTDTITECQYLKFALYSIKSCNKLSAHPSFSSISNLKEEDKLQLLDQTLFLAFSLDCNLQYLWFLGTNN